MTIFYIIIGVVITFLVALIAFYLYSMPPKKVVKRSEMEDNNLSAHEIQQQQLNIAHRSEKKPPLTRQAGSTSPSNADRIRGFAEMRRKDLSKLSSFPPLLSLHVGGAGTGMSPGETVFIGATDEKVIIFSAVNKNSYDIRFAELTAVEISGPGTQITNAGLIGGGFGLEGAATGIVAAALVNAATTKSSTNTFLRFATNQAEAIFHFNDQEPSGLRIILSPVVVAADANRITKEVTPSFSEEVIKLQALKESGVISEDEFRAAKSKFLT